MRERQLTNWDQRGGGERRGGQTGRVHCWSPGGNSARREGSTVAAVVAHRHRLFLAVSK